MTCRLGVSVVVPTLNSGRTLRECLASVRAQEYPSPVQLVVADGGSSDDTLDIARAHGADIVSNVRRTGEAGKAVGLRHARHALVAFIDSDNILPARDWLLKMTEPFDEADIALAEPIEYAYRSTDAWLTRYCALMGMNDPLCFFLGNYDRVNRITGRWTEVRVHEEDRGGYLRVRLAAEVAPTVGANGTIFRRIALDSYEGADYFFDIDVACHLMRQGHILAKVRVGIVHVFSGDVRTFARKQQRRIMDYLYHRRRGARSYPWRSRPAGVVKFAASTVTVAPLLVQTARGYAACPDVAWFFHPVACWVTLLVYGNEVLCGAIRPRQKDRSTWTQ